MRNFSSLEATEVTLAGWWVVKKRVQWVQIAAVENRL